MLRVLAWAWSRFESGLEPSALFRHRYSVLSLPFGVSRRKNSVGDPLTVDAVTSGNLGVRFLSKTASWDTTTT